MTRTKLRPAAVAGALALLLTACSSGDPGPTASPSASSPSASASSSPMPTSTLSADEQEAFEQVTDVVVAYQQTVVDLYTGARTDVNDINMVVAPGDLLDATLKNTSQGLSQGYRMEPADAQVVLISSEPVSVELDEDPPTVVVRACIDQSAITIVSPDGTTKPGLRDELDYTVIKTDYLPAPGWAVQSMEGDPDPEDRAC